MNLKEEKTEVLWALIGELSKILAERQFIPPAERTGLYKDTQNALCGIISALMQEINDRNPDSATV